MGNEVRITYRWPDETSLFVTVVADNAYPDALDQARATARRVFADALLTIADGANDDDTDDTDIV